MVVAHESDLHSAVFLDALVDVFDPNLAHFHKRCTSVTESLTNPERLVVHFQDGSTFEADVVLGADGVKSHVRNFVLGGDDRRLAFSHTVVYRGLITWPKLEAAGFKITVKDYPVCITGLDKVSTTTLTLRLLANVLVPSTSSSSQSRTAKL